MKSIFLALTLLSFCVDSFAGEQTVTTSDGVNLYVKVEGSGTPLLYIHGGPGSGSLWFEKLMGAFLEQSFTVVYLDQRGAGRSSSPEDKNYSLDRMSLDFEEVREALGFESWLTLGHSFGGLLQMGYIQRYPAANKGMIMLNATLDLKASACDSWLPKAAELLGTSYSCKGDTTALPQRMNEFGGKLRDNNLFWRMGSRHEDAFSKLDEASSEIENFNYDLGGHVMKASEYWEDFRVRTPLIDVPVLYFYGKTDYMVGPDHFKSLKFPKLLLWENQGGHVPFIEDPEDLEKAILTFKQKNNF